MLGQEKDTVAFLRAYKSSLTDIQTYVSQLYAKYSTDGVLSLNDMYLKTRYSDMEKEINNIVKSLGNKEKDYFKSELTKTYEKSYISTGTILTEGIPKLAINFNKIPTGFVNTALTYPWSGDSYSNRIWKNKEALISNLKQTLTRGFINGSSISNMTKDLKGVLDGSATACRKLIRTEAMHCIGASHNDTYKAAGVKRVKFITAEDDRVCKICNGIANSSKNPFLIEDAPMIPIHANSRSISIPYFED